MNGRDGERVKETLKEMLDLSHQLQRCLEKWDEVSRRLWRGEGPGRPKETS